MKIIAALMIISVILWYKMMPSNPDNGMTKEQKIETRELVTKALNLTKNPFKLKSLNLSHQRIEYLRAVATCQGFNNVLLAIRQKQNAPHSVEATQSFINNQNRMIKKVASINNFKLEDYKKVYDDALSVSSLFHANFHTDLSQFTVTKWDKKKFKDSQIHCDRLPRIVKS